MSTPAGASMDGANHASEPLSVRVWVAFDAELEAVWRALESACDHYGFQCYDWISHWYRTVGAHSHWQPTVAVISLGAKPVALFPFGLHRTVGIRVLEFLGGEQSDYNAPLIDSRFADAGILASIWERVLSALPRHDLRMLRRLPEALPHGPNAALSIWPTRPTNRAYAARLSGTFEDFLQRVPKNLRSDSRRQLKKLAGHGEVTFAVSSDAADFDAVANAMIEQKRRRFQETGVRDALADPARQAFYRECRGRLGERGFVHLSALRVGSTIVATHWGMVYGDRFYYLMPSFASGVWKTLSVGRLLQERLIQWSLEQGLQWFDFSVGDEKYKRIWCDHELVLHDSVTPASLAGRAFHVLSRSASWAKRNKTTRSALMALLRAARKITLRRGEVGAPE